MVVVISAFEGSLFCMTGACIMRPGVGASAFCLLPQPIAMGHKQLIISLVNLVSRNHEMCKPIGK